MKRRFEFSEGSSNKFWEIELSGNTHTVTYGKIGTAGQTKTKDFADATVAQKDYDKLVAEKTKKGYKETTKGGAAAAPAGAVGGTAYSVVFPTWYDDRAEAEAPAKGYLSGVEVCLAGDRYRLYFIDPVRLQQTLDDDARDGRPFFTEPNLVVLPEVTTESIHEAVKGLVRDGYLPQLKPITNGG
jgi:predicted DNA-binding WGR domain protein